AMVAISVARRFLLGGHLHSELRTSENSERATKIFPSTTLAGYDPARWPGVFIVSPHGPEALWRRATRQRRLGRIATGARRNSGLRTYRCCPGLQTAEFRREIVSHRWRRAA